MSVWQPFVSSSVWAALTLVRTVVCMCVMLCVSRYGSQKGHHSESQQERIFAVVVCFDSGSYSTVVNALMMQILFVCFPDMYVPVRCARYCTLPFH
jgi:hypothetical protein